MPDTGAMTSTVPQEPRASFDSWGPYALLTAGVVAAALSARAVGMGRSAMALSAVLVAVGAVLQMWWGRAKRRQSGPSRTGVCFYFLRWALGFVLTWLNPFFAFYAVTGYYTAARELPRRLVYSASVERS